MKVAGAPIEETSPRKENGVNDVPKVIENEIK